MHATTKTRLAEKEKKTYIIFSEESLLHLSSDDPETSYTLPVGSHSPLKRYPKTRRIISSSMVNEIVLSTKKGFPVKGIERVSSHDSLEESVSRVWLYFVASLPWLSSRYYLGMLVEKSPLPTKLYDTQDCRTGKKHGKEIDIRRGHLPLLFERRTTVLPLFASHFDPLLDGLFPSSVSRLHRILCVYSKVLQREWKSPTKNHKKKQQEDDDDEERHERKDEMKGLNVVSLLDLVQLPLWFCPAFGHCHPRRASIVFISWERLFFSLTSFTDSLSSFSWSLDVTNIRWSKWWWLCSGHAWNHRTRSLHDGHMSYHGYPLCPWTSLSHRISCVTQAVRMKHHPSQDVKHESMSRTLSTSSSRQHKKQEITAKRDMTGTLFSFRLPCLPVISWCIFSLFLFS